MSERADIIDIYEFLAHAPGAALCGVRQAPALFVSQRCLNGRDACGTVGLYRASIISITDRTPDWLEFHQGKPRKMRTNDSVPLLKHLG